MEHHAAADTTNDATRSAAQAPALALVRELVRTYQAFEAYALPDIRRHGLGPAEFDVLVTLGNTSGMTFKELAQRTLIYKTTLTGVVDRLERAGYARREASARDRRSLHAVLTPEGERLFREIFPAHVAHLRTRLDTLGEGGIAEAMETLRGLRERLE